MTDGDGGGGGGSGGGSGGAEEEEDDDGGDWFQAQLNSRWRDYQEERARQEQTKARYTYYGSAYDGYNYCGADQGARDLSLGGRVGT